MQLHVPFELLRGAASDDSGEEEDVGSCNL